MKFWKFSAVVRPSQTKPCDGSPHSLILVEQTNPNATPEHCAQCVDGRELTIDTRNRCFSERIHEMFDDTKRSFKCRFFSFGNIMKKIGNETPPMTVCTMYNVAIVFDAVRYVPSANISTAVAALCRIPCDEKSRPDRILCRHRSRRKYKSVCRRCPDLSQRHSSSLE